MAGEATPVQYIRHTPNTMFVMMFVAQVLNGFRAHPSAFLESVCEFYEIELIHQNPNTVVMLGIFAFFCEACLVVPPSLKCGTASTHHLYSRMSMLSGRSGSVSTALGMFDLRQT